MDNRRVIRPLIRRAFQLSASVYIKNDIKDTVKFHARNIYNWGKNHLPEDNPFRKFPGTFSWSKAGYRMETICDYDKPYFCLLLEHPDSDVPGRVWLVEAELFSDGKDVIMGTRVSYTSQSADDYLPKIAPPRFVNIAYNKRELFDAGYMIMDEPRFVDCDEDLDALFDLVTSEKRKLPIIVVTERSVRGREAVVENGYLVSPEKLAQEVGLFAHVYCIPAEYQGKWTDCVTYGWSVYDGAIRTYFPGVDFDSDNYWRHPVTVPNTILMSSLELDDQTCTGGDAYLYILAEKTRRNRLDQRIDWESYGHKFYYSAKRELVQSDTVSDEVRITLENNLEDVKRENETLWADLEKTDDELQDAKEKIHKFESLILALETALKSAGKDGPICIPDDCTYAMLPEWISNNYPGRIVLHSRAERELKKFEFEDVSFVYEVIMLMGTEYYKMKKYGFDYVEAYEQKCAELGIEETITGSDSSLGEYKEDYYVKHHNKKMKLDRHIKKGVSRDARETMRIYFFWDSENSEIVIGSICQHLRTKNS